MAPVVRFVPKRIAGAKPIVGVEPLSSSYPGSCLKYLYSPSESASEDEARDNTPSKSAGEDEARDNPQDGNDTKGDLEDGLRELMDDQEALAEMGIQLPSGPSRASLARESAGEDEARESAGEDEEDSDDWGSWRGFHASSP